MERLLKQRLDKNYQILATDISNYALERSKRAEYSDLEIKRGLDQEHLDTYFKKLPDGQWKVDPSITQKVSFQRRNLVESWHDSIKYDIIFCRNVLIYQSVEGKRAVVDKIYERLNPGGCLILGGPESLIGISDKFVPFTRGKVVFNTKPENLPLAANE